MLNVSKSGLCFAFLLDINDPTLHCEWEEEQQQPQQKKGLCIPYTKQQAVPIQESLAICQKLESRRWNPIFVLGQCTCELPCIQNLLFVLYCATYMVLIITQKHRAIFIKKHMDLGNGEQHLRRL